MAGPSLLWKAETNGRGGDDPMIRKLILAVALLAIAAVPMSVLAREDDRRELNGGREQLERHELERRPFFFGVYPEPFYAAPRCCWESGCWVNRPFVDAKGGYAYVPQWVPAQRVCYWMRS